MHPTPSARGSKPFAQVVSMGTHAGLPRSARLAPVHASAGKTGTQPAPSGRDEKPEGHEVQPSGLHSPPTQAGTQS